MLSPRREEIASTATRRSVAPTAAVCRIPAYLPRAGDVCQITERSRARERESRRDARRAERHRLPEPSAPDTCTAMIDLYYWPTPNGWKISIMLEECALPYAVK